MRKFLQNSIESINEVIVLTAQKKKLPEAIIEKDIWVSYLLEYLFCRCKYKRSFEFKGGTSLSKGYHLINRFSEDVDLVLDVNIFGVNINEIISLPSRNQKQKWASELNGLAIRFFENQLIPVLKNDLSNELNKEVNVHLNNDEFSIYVEYPSTFSSSYINSSVKLEMGPLAAWTPNEEKTVKSFIQEIYPDLFEKSEFLVLITKPERTFWEKALILHQEANRCTGNLPQRYSRHYYDLFRMYYSPVRMNALANMSLLNEVRDFSMSFYNRSWAKLNEAVPGSFRLYPNEQYKKVLKEDYKRMRIMLYGNEVPEFDTVLNVIEKLEKEINSKGNN